MHVLGSVNRPGSFDPVLSRFAGDPDPVGE
jgi:hypothetical protein